MIQVPKPARPMPILLIVLATLALVRIGLAQLMPSSYIFFDELVYLKLAQGFADYHAPFLRGHFLNFPSILYPLLLAPTQLAHAPHVGFKAAQITNVVLVTTAGLPIFLMTRRLVDERFALGVAVLSLLGPYLIYTNVVMSENLFFPILAWLGYVLMRSLKGGWGWKVLLGVVLGLAFFAKPHGMFLPLVVGLTVLAGGPRSQILKRVLSYWPAVLVLAGFALLHVLKTNYFLHSASLLDLSTFFGTYSSGFGGRPLNVLLFLRSVFANLAAIGLSTGCLPLVLFVPFAVRALRQGTDEERAFAVFTLTLALLLIGITARHTVTLDDPNRIHERYCFHLAPFFLIGAARAAQARWFSPKALLIAGLLTAVACVSFLPQAMASPFMADTPSFASLWISVLSRGLRATVLLYEAIGALFALGLAYLVIRSRWKSAFALAAGYALVISGYALQAQAITSHDYARHFRFADWVQAHAGPDTPIAILADRLPMIDIWSCESASRQPLSVYYMGAPADTWNDLPVTTTGEGEIAELSRLPDGALVVAHRAKRLLLPEVGRLDDAVLYRKEGPVKLALAGTLSGVGADAWSVGSFAYEVRNRAGLKAATFELMVDTHGLPKRLDPVPVTITDGAGTRQVVKVGLDRTETLKVEVHPQATGFRITVDSPGWVPAKEGSSGDTRTLGVMVKGVDLYAD